jgi:uncharacterized NAD(P)/FAD-binding protein YdhS
MSAPNGAGASLADGIGSEPRLPPAGLKIAGGDGGRARARVIVVGGGAAGTLTAVHLLREARNGAIEVVLIDREGEFGPGVAYGTPDPLHLLNVPAIRMGGIAGHPEHFFDWLERRGAHAGAEAFVSRGLFGEYLRELLDETERDCGPGAQLSRLAGEVVSVAEPEGLGSRLRVELADGERIEADRLVLALGHLRGGDPIPVPEELRANGVYVSDPWAAEALDPVRGDDSVLIVGTGLTMVDVSLSLGRDPRGPSLLAVSRHGLVPKRHRHDLTRIQKFPVPVESGELEPVVLAVLEQIGRVAQQGGDWRDVFDSMRSSTPAIWRGLRVEEKQRFLVHLQRFWDVHRFRMAPQVADRFEDLRGRGRVRVDAGSIVSFEPRGHGTRVSLRAAGQDGLRTVEVDRVINCTGAGVDLLRQAPPLIASLIGSGRARPDELGIGLDVDPRGSLRDSAGRPSDRIHVVGGLRKGVEWEAIGVTEIRDHAAVVARRVFAAGTEEMEMAL